MKECKYCGMPVDKSKRYEDDKDCELRVCKDGKILCTTCYLCNVTEGNAQELCDKAKEFGVCYHQDTGDVVVEFIFDIKDTDWFTYELAK